jgi:membrane associated rhomboid family serine protease
VTVLLIALHVGAYAAQWLMELIEQDPFSFANWLRGYLALDGAGIDANRYWQFATFSLLHYSPLHVAVNLLVPLLCGAGSRAHHRAPTLPRALPAR